MANKFISDYQESFFCSDFDKANIFVRSWYPSTEIQPKAVVQITHGICEHGGRYDLFARVLSANGYAVYALDLRGHGMTAGLDRLGQAGISAWSDMTKDIAQLSRIIKVKHPFCPLIAFGHSMGSALTQYHIQNYAGMLDGAVLCGTLGALPNIESEKLIELKSEAYSTNQNQPSKIFSEILQAFNAPFVSDSGPATGCEWMTTDVVEIQKFIEDPFCGKPFSNSMMFSIVEGFSNLWKIENELRIPPNLDLFIIAGTNDLVGANTLSIQSLISRYMKHGHLTLSYRFYEGDRHEILNGINKTIVQKDIINWLDCLIARFS